MTLGLSGLAYTAPPAGYDTRFENAKGLLTGSRTYRLDDPSEYTVSALYYDHRGRIVQTHRSNHLGGFEEEYFAYTFTGKVKRRMHRHSAPGKLPLTEVYEYAYDHAERLLSVTHRLNGAPAVTLTACTYDEAGRMKTKTFHEAVETQTYDYNVRGHLTRITGTKFCQTLAGNETVNGLTPSRPCYNGNIAAIRWKAGDETADRGYQFTYDALNRLTSSRYGEGASLAANPDRYDESFTYDKTGNILTLQRKGLTDKKPAPSDADFGMIDNLSFTYTGNRVTKITDAVTSGPLYAGAFHFMDGADKPAEYLYDANGNLKKDYNKKIVEIRYNSLNLPERLQFANGNTIDYVYDAAGDKLSVTHRTAVTGVVIPMTGVMTPPAPAQIFSELTTDYCGNVMYEDGEPVRILTEEGYVTLTGNGNNAFPTYYYYLKDHQGNNRVVIDQAGTVEQVNHYYPFGGLFGEGLQTSNQPYRYNGKELDRQLSLDLYDYGARHYDAALGRWLTVDPMAEKYYSISSYAYCGNNPVNRIDPDGMSYDWVENRDKHIYWDKNAISQATTKKGETYIGKTVYATNADGSFRYGDQFGNWHNSAPLGEVTVRGFQTSGSGPVSAAIRQAAGGYDPKWIAGFNKFVEGELKAIELTLTFATLAHDLNNLGGSGIRAGVNLIDDAAKGGSKVPNFIVSKGGTVFPVPRGATGPIPASSGKGFQFIKGVGDKGLSPKAMGFRFMDPITTGKYQYPGGYGSYFNKAGQTINPFTGQTISPSNPWWHIPAK